MSNTPEHFAHLKDKFVTIVALGDSNTEQNHWTCGSLCWAGMLPMGLYNVFPKGKCVINSGISGDSVEFGLKRLERDVLRFNPDIVIISYGGNDSFKVSLETFRERLPEMINVIRNGCSSSIILKTPTPMIDMMTGLETNTIKIGETVYQTDLAAFSSVICDVAGKENLLLVDHYSKWKRSMESSCRQDIIRLMGNPQHPNALGHRRLYHELAPVFNADTYFYYDWQRILIDTEAF